MEKRILMKLKTIGLLFVFLLSSTSCSQVTLAPKEQDRLAKLFREKQNIAQVYLFRSGYMGRGRKQAVSVDGTFIGYTKPFTYYKFNLTPGEHTFVSQKDYSELTVDLQANKIYYIWQEGIYPDWSNLFLVGKEQAAKLMSNCKLLIPDSEIYK